MRLYYRRFSLFNLFASAQGVFVLPSHVAALQRFSAGRPAFSPLIYPKHSWCRVFGTGQRSFLTGEVLECRKAIPQKAFKKRKKKKKTFLHDYYCCLWFVVKQTYVISSIYSSFQLALFMWLRGDLYLRRSGEMDSPFPCGHGRMSNWCLPDNEGTVLDSRAQIGHECNVGVRRELASSQQRPESLLTTDAALASRQRTKSSTATLLSGTCRQNPQTLL